MKSEKKEVCPICHKTAIMDIDSYGKIRTYTCTECGETFVLKDNNDEPPPNISVIMTTAVLYTATIET